MTYGFCRVASASPEIVVADCKKNANKIIDTIRDAHQNGASIIVFPELSVTSYSCGDLFLQQTLLDSAFQETENIARKTKHLPVLISVGLPISYNGALYNCAAIIYKGKIIALVPKTYIPSYSEFYERRYFSHGKSFVKSFITIDENTQKLNEVVYVKGIPFDTNILICDKTESNFVFSVEICEDLWVANQPSIKQALYGATIIGNLSASNETIGKSEYRKLLVKSHSAKTICAYIYSNANCGESTQDVVFASHNIIAESGNILAESSLFDGSTIYADIDLESIIQERQKTTTFSQCAENTQAHSDECFIKIQIDICSEIKQFSKTNKTIRKISKTPFVPENDDDIKTTCKEVLEMQGQALSKRIRHINTKSVVIGLSGGLDSTLALIATCRAFDLCNIERSGIYAITMPCFGTTDRTYNNACMLAKEIGATLKEINISDAVKIHFRDLSHDENNHDITYENAQARERTQVLMDFANIVNGIVIGTGDLSEAALGWCTYNGDHISMYGVNSSIPKTLIKHIVKFYADTVDNNKLQDILNDILETPVSPELLPPSDSGSILQKTEDIVGPYELHDFFLYYMIRFGFSPSKIMFLADNAHFSYSHSEILKWIRIFYKRFFAAQFKRSCVPDGVKVGSVSLSPRGDWRMPSDANAEIWLNEIDNLK